MGVSPQSEAPRHANHSVSPAAPSRVVWISALTMFLSAFLLFHVQLIINKYILPWFGGSAAVWTTDMLVFQLLLVSSRHINLLPVVEGLREYSHSYSIVKFTAGNYPFIENLWVFLTKRPETLQFAGISPNPPPGLPQAEPRLWTDDYSDIFRLIY